MVMHINNFGRGIIMIDVGGRGGSSVEYQPGFESIVQSSNPHPNNMLGI